ncbi:MAG: transposase [Verrucomicrobiia bacterium]
MSPESHSSPGRIPYNPELDRLVRAKQEWSGPFDPGEERHGFAGWHQRGYLPHRDSPGLRQLVTFRLIDAMPASRRSEWEAFAHLEDSREGRKKLEEYLDAGMGECWLRDSRIAGVAEGALRFFDKERYQLLAWVIMPNHVHVLVEVWNVPLSSLARSWKRFIAREANKILGRTGAFWEREYWDTWMRDDKHTLTAVKYVESNPVKAYLVRDPRAWGRSSARFRDEFGQLRC